MTILECQLTMLFKNKRIIVAFSIFITIFISFSTSFIYMINSILNSYIDKFSKLYGGFDCILYDVDNDLYDEIYDSSILYKTRIYSSDNIKIKDDNLTLGSFDNDIISLGLICLLDGKMPEKQDDIVLEEYAAKYLDVTNCGTKLTLIINNIKRDFIVTGIIKNYSSFWNSPISTDNGYKYLPSIIVSEKFLSLYSTYKTNILLKYKNFSIDNDYSSLTFSLGDKYNIYYKNVIINDNFHTSLQNIIPLNLLQKVYNSFLYISFSILFMYILYYTCNNLIMLNISSAYLISTYLIKFLFVGIFFGLMFTIIFNAGLYNSTLKISLLLQILSRNITLIVIIYIIDIVIFLSYILRSYRKPYNYIVLQVNKHNFSYNFLSTNISMNIKRNIIPILFMLISLFILCMFNTLLPAISIDSSIRFYDYAISPFTISESRWTGEYNVIINSDNYFDYQYVNDLENKDYIEYIHKIPFTEWSELVLNYEDKYFEVNNKLTSFNHDSNNITIDNMPNDINIFRYNNIDFEVFDIKEFDKLCQSLSNIDKNEFLYKNSAVIFLPKRNIHSSITNSTNIKIVHLTINQTKKSATYVENQLKVIQVINNNMNMNFNNILIHSNKPVIIVSENTAEKLRLFKGYQRLEIYIKDRYKESYIVEKDILEFISKYSNSFYFSHKEYLTILLYVKNSLIYVSSSIIIISIFCCILISFINIYEYIRNNYASLRAYIAHGITESRLLKIICVEYLTYMSFSLIIGLIITFLLGHYFNANMNNIMIWTLVLSTTEILTFGFMFILFRQKLTNLLD
jgi:hypothetical protein